MAKKKVKSNMYKGYDIKWLKNNPDHPQSEKLVAEYEKKVGKIK